MSAAEKTWVAAAQWADTGDVEELEVQASNRTEAIIKMRAMLAVDYEPGGVLMVATVQEAVGGLRVWQLCPANDAW